VRVARALEKLPKISAAMERGELSYSNARALTRVACEATEDTLLMVARHGTTEHVERLVRGFRRCKDAAELAREEQQQRNRYFQYRYADDGSIVLEGRLPAEVGTLFLKALEAALPEMPRVESERFEGRDVPAETLVSRVPLADGCEGRCEIEEGPSMAAETARRLACDSTVIPLIENDQGEPLSESTVRSEPVNRLFRARTLGPALVEDLI